MNLVKKGKEDFKSRVQKPTQNEKPTDDNHDIDLHPITHQEHSPNPPQQKNMEEDPEEGGIFKCFKWLCRIFSGISFTLKVQITLFVIAAAIIIGGSALIGFFVNGKFHLAIVPEATLAFFGAYMTYQLKDNVDTVGDILETIKGFLEPKSGNDGPEGIVAAVVQAAFDELKAAMISCVKMMIVGPPVGSILVGTVGVITGACFLKFVGNTDDSIRLISVIVIIVSGIAIVGGFPALCICIAAFKRLKKKIEVMVDKLQQKLLDKIAS